DEASRQDAGIIEDEQIARREEIRQVAEVMVGQIARRSIRDEKSGGVPVGGGFLGDQVRGKFVVEVITGAGHGFSAAVTALATSREMSSNCAPSHRWRMTPLWSMRTSVGR